MFDIGTQKPQGKTFAINVAIRNPRGEIVSYKSLETDSAAELFDFWQVNSGTPNNKKKNKKVDLALSI